uniref:RING-type E3 ubiquitin transferase n=1 Tax=Rhizophora mucronata TaxID=61149 RepID=A0A2P2L2V2_RHIMU
MLTLHHHRHGRFLLDTETSSTTPQPNGSRASGGFSNEANFDTNMVIILAALLCALVCALGLNSIVRCAQRCSRRIAFETPDEADARLAATGLRKNILRQIPAVIYGAARVPIIATDCAICLGEFVYGEKVRILPKCNHCFHVKCIDTWFLAQSSCPTCRQSLVEQPQISDAGQPDAGIRHPPVAQNNVPISVHELA